MSQKSDVFRGLLLQQLVAFFRVLLHRIGDTCCDAMGERLRLPSRD